MVSRDDDMVLVVLITGLVIVSRFSLTGRVRFYFNFKERGAGGVAQAIEHPPYKHKP
jgi:hypothetical protein